MVQSRANLAHVFRGASDQSRPLQRLVPIFVKRKTSLCTSPRSPQSGIRKLSIGYIVPGCFWKCPVVRLENHRGFTAARTGFGDGDKVSCWEPPVSRAVKGFGVGNSQTDNSGGPRTTPSNFHCFPTGEIGRQQVVCRGRRSSFTRSARRTAGPSGGFAGVVGILRDFPFPAEAQRSRRRDVLGEVQQSSLGVLSMDSRVAYHRS